MEEWLQEVVEGDNEGDTDYGDAVGEGEHGGGGDCSGRGGRF